MSVTIVFPGKVHQLAVTTSGGYIPLGARCIKIGSKPNRDDALLLEWIRYTVDGVDEGPGPAA